MFSSALSPKISDIPSVNKTLSLKKPRFISKAGHNMYSERRLLLVFFLRLFYSFLCASFDFQKPTVGQLATSKEVTI